MPHNKTIVIENVKIKGVSHSVCGRSSEMKSKTWELKEEVQPGEVCLSQVARCPLRRPTPGRHHCSMHRGDSDVFGDALLAKAAPVSTVWAV